MKETVIKIKNLEKTFSNEFYVKTALNGIDLEIGSSSIVGLVGPNGAGKSTLLRHIVGLYIPSFGTCETLGKASDKLTPRELERLGYVHQEGELISWLSVRGMIDYVKSYYRNWNDELEKDYIKRFDVNCDTKVKVLSPGERQKVAILLAIGFEPQLLILDEPAAAMDPLMRANFLNLLLDMIQTEGRTIIISSHILSDIEKVVDHIVLMKEGKILRDCELDMLREEFCRVKISSVTGEMPEKLPLEEEAIDCRKNVHEALITMKGSFRNRLNVDGKKRGLNLEYQHLSLDEIYRLVVTEGEKE